MPLRVILSSCVLIATVAAAPAGASESTESAAGPIAEKYRAAAERILSQTLEHNDAFNKLEMLCDGIGHRLSGSAPLEQAVTWAADAMSRDGMEQVRLEEVEVTHWVRGAESAALVQPRPHPLVMLGLGGSVGTPPEGITAEVVVVADEDELERVAERAAGRIVLFNNRMPAYDPVQGSGYGQAVRFRGRGAQLAAGKGAVACLIRSVTAHSLRSPHTGAMSYGDAPVKIPAAAISVEDAEMLARLQARGITPVVTLRMEARTVGTAKSANVVAELRGSTAPDEYVVIGGHIDSWDVGQGAHDDGAGCVTVMEAVHVLHRLGLRPRRTIRVVLWTNEENGLAGAKKYAEVHADELSRHVAAIEADSGAFRPIGYGVECSAAPRAALAVTQLRDILSLVSSIGATDVITGFSGADLIPLRESDIVLLGHRVEGSRYFDYHHSPADTLDKVDPLDLSQNVAVMATVAYIIADMPRRLGDPAASE